MKFNKSQPILAREGWIIIAITFVLTLIFWLSVGGFISFLFWVVFIFVLQFFRDPKRPVSQTPHAVLAGADGRICKVQKTTNPYTGKEMMLISTFMNVFNVHSNWCPVSGVVKEIHYIPGRFINADLDKASELNERNAIVVQSDEGPTVTWVQIAGLVARRIVCGLHIGQEVSKGERFGFIRFGSRVDVYVPMDAEILVYVGQKVRAADTVLALLKVDKGADTSVVENPVQEAIEDGITEVENKTGL